MIDTIERALGRLPPAERRVAEHVLAHPRLALAQPVAEIARAATVSQPTVIRFCRSLGCDGLSDFKLQLAAGLNGQPLALRPVGADEPALELGAKVLGNSAAAILRARERLQREPLERAIALLAAAARVEFHASGAEALVAADAQRKFLRLGVPAAAVTDPSLQMPAAQALRHGDALVLIGHDGPSAAPARERGAAVIAITTPQSPLARRADVVLTVDAAEDAATQLLMLGRLLQLLMIDILVVGVTLRRGGDRALLAHCSPPNR